VGLLSMRERAEELGGSCSIASSGSPGTYVSALLPFPKDFLAGHRSEVRSLPSDDVKPVPSSGVGGQETEGER
jgi:hypothetical protein